MRVGGGQTLHIAATLAPPDEGDHGDQFVGTGMSGQLGCLMGTLGDDPTHIASFTQAIEFVDELDSPFGREIVQHPTGGDGRMTMRLGQFDRFGESVDGITVSDHDVMVTREFDRLAKTPESFHLIGPDARLQPANFFIIVNVDGLHVDARRP